VHETPAATVDVVDAVEVVDSVSGAAGLVVVVVVTTTVDSGLGPDSADEHCARSNVDATKEINFRCVRFLRIAGSQIVKRAPLSGHKQVRRTTRSRHKCGRICESVGTQLVIRGCSFCWPDTNEVTIPGVEEFNSEALNLSDRANVEQSIDFLEELGDEW